MSKILLLGGTGFIGYNIAQKISKFEPNNHSITKLIEKLVNYCWKMYLQYRHLTRNLIQNSEVKKDNKILVNNTIRRIDKSYK